MAPAQDETFYTIVTSHKTNDGMIGTPEVPEGYELLGEWNIVGTTSDNSKNFTTIHYIFWKCLIRKKRTLVSEEPNKVITISSSNKEPPLLWDDKPYYGDDKWEWDDE